jgi:hypothetical protein
MEQDMSIHHTMTTTTTTFEFNEQELDLLEYGLALIASRMQEGTLNPQDIKGVTTYQEVVDLYAKIVVKKGR